MANAGIAPLDSTTNIGITRALITDTQFVALNPVVAGQGNYSWFSDVEIASFLAVGANNPLMATGFAFLALAGQVAANEANVDVQSLDFKVTSSKRAADLRADAQVWFSMANNTEQVSLVNTGVSTLDFRDYLYPTGNLIFSDLFWLTDYIPLNSSPLLEFWP